MYNYGISSEPLLGSNETSLKYHLRGSKITKNDFKNFFQKLKFAKNDSFSFGTGSMVSKWPQNPAKPIKSGQKSKLTKLATRN